MINHEENPEYLNSFLDYTMTILNKSPNTIKEYNYDLAMFLKFIKTRFRLTDEEDYSMIEIKDISLDTIKQIKLDDIHAFLSYLTTTYHSKAATRARKASSIRVFFNYLCAKANLIDSNPAQNLETPKLDKRLPKYLSLEDSQKLLEVTENEDNRNYQRDYAVVGYIEVGKTVSLSKHDDFSNGRIHYKLSFGETFDEEFYKANCPEIYHDWTNDASGKEQREDRTFCDMEKLDLKWNRNYDQTRLRQTYTNYIFRKKGLIAQQTSLTNVNLYNGDTKQFSEIYEVSLDD